MHLVRRVEVFKDVKGREHGWQRGGGFWLIRIRRNRQAKERLELKDRFFSGVVFYELAHENGVVSAIRSHGRRSVFDYALNK